MTTTSPTYVRRVCNHCHALGEHELIDVDMLRCANCQHVQPECEDAMPRPPEPTDPQQKRLARKGNGHTPAPMAAVQPDAPSDDRRWAERIQRLEARADRAVAALTGRADRAPRLRIKLMSSTAQLPRYQTDGAAGLDMHADLRNREAITLDAARVVLVPSGIAVEIPPGYVGLVRGRSGLAKRGIHVPEGTIDSDYRGEVHVMMRGVGVVKHCDRIGQLVIVPSPRFELEQVDELSETTRGAGSFGSTGR